MFLWSIVMAENNRFERIAALLEERKANERRLAELTGHANGTRIISNRIIQLFFPEK